MQRCKLFFAQLQRLIPTDLRFSLGLPTISNSCETS